LWEVAQIGTRGAFVNAARGLLALRVGENDDGENEVGKLPTK